MIGHLREATPRFIYCPGQGHDPSYNRGTQKEVLEFLKKVVMNNERCKGQICAREMLKTVPRAGDQADEATAGGHAWVNERAWRPLRRQALVFHGCGGLQPPISNMLTFEIDLI